MATRRPPASLAPGATTLSWKKAGAIVREARLRSGLTLADLGRACGYSASQISRYERGVQPLTDVTLLRRFADALAIQPNLLGLADRRDALASRHAGANQRTTNIGGPCLVQYFRQEDGDDPVRRRELLAAAGLAGAAVLAPGASRPGHAPIPQASMSCSTGSRPAPSRSQRCVWPSQSSARNIRRLATTGYPQVFPAWSAWPPRPSGAVSSKEESTVSSLLADAYIVAANLMVKVNDTLALALADRALRSAHAGDDPLTTADARRAVATVLRRTGRRARAHDLLLSAAAAIEPGRETTPEQLSVFGTLLEVAAYTAAVDGNRAVAHELIGEAKETAGRLGKEANHRYTAFGPANVTLYQISIAQAHGDNGTAIEHAKALNPAMTPTAERQGHYWIDVARSFHQWNKPEQCYRALLCAERAAPAEISATGGRSTA